MIALVALAGLSMAETLDLTWVGASGGKWNEVTNWVITGTEDHPDSIPAYSNTTEAIYRIGDGANVSAENVSIGNLKGTLIIGDNVTFGGNWAVVFHDVVLGDNMTWQHGGDGIKFTLNSGSTIASESEANTLKLNTIYSGTNILSTLGTGSSVDFGTAGKIIAPSNAPYGETCLGQYSAGSPRALTLTAQIETALTDNPETVGVVDRVLIESPKIWYRDLDGKYRDDMFGLTLTSLDGTSMIKYDSVMDPTAAWTINGVETELAQGAYRSYATIEGIGVQYYIAPEPATATLSLLALAGLASRRRRH